MGSAVPLLSLNDGPVLSASAPRAPPEPAASSSTTRFVLFRACLLAAVSPGHAEAPDTSCLHFHSCRSSPTPRHARNACACPPVTPRLSAALTGLSCHPARCSVAQHFVWPSRIPSPGRPSCGAGPREGSRPGGCALWAIRATEWGPVIFPDAVHASQRSPVSLTAPLTAATPPQALPSPDCCPKGKSILRLAATTECLASPSAS